ncbi:hypothetical protein LSTR_LSTR003352 [Laodelphax striatellus]|uniref:Uncharacterized protein n=1 Tax=Laodelphax striatellus TaxID=195883 RepID=A0A482X576_LAOST|nr:hypothetical protein LSTR_LSTR003352 [Laodelphax striatellus]
MYISVTPIIALYSYILIGSQRSLANPTFAADSLLEVTSTETPKNHDVPHTIDENGGRDLKHNWECQAESDFIQKQIALTSKLLSDGEQVIRKQGALSVDETLLVLGKAGSGKTTLVQFLTQNPKLQSKQVRANTGEYIIEDGEKIGTSATDSFTLYPEIVNYNSFINFCDSPGFHDSRSSAHEVVSMDVMKSITSKFKKVKILLIENHGSLQYGVTKDSFISTLQHLDDFLVDIDKYRDHIVLIATKIPLTYITTEDDINIVSGIVTEEMHIESVMEYLNLTEASIAKKLNHDIGKTKENFYKKVIKLLQSLQTRDENGRATRINVFRRPYKSGPLINMSLLEKNKESLIKTIMNLSSVEVSENDFGLTLSNEAKMYLECLLKLTSDNYKNKINELSLKLNEFVTQKTQSYSSFEQVLSDMKSLYYALKQLSENLDETRNFIEFFEKLNGFISDQKISSHTNSNERIHVLEKYEEMLHKILDTNLVFSPSSWFLPIRQVIKFVEDEMQWYKSLNKFISRLASYQTQKNKTEIFSTVFHQGSISTSDLMDLFMRITENTSSKQFIDAQDITKRRLELESITTTLLLQSNITCDANGRLRVKGFQIRIAEINLENLSDSHCNNIPVKEVALLAVETIFLDEDTTDSFNGVNMFIAAPKWVVIGQRRIVLSGKSGPQANHSYDDGENGKPGLPGDNSGSFFGIGLQFLNGENLYIEMNGGRGGHGSNGAKGAKGDNGRDAGEILGLGLYSDKDKILTFNEGFESDALESGLLIVAEERKLIMAYCPPDDKEVSTRVGLVRKEGECGVEGHPGGLGGEAGIGGFAGDMQLVELGDVSRINIQNKTGSFGTRGSKGENGDKGEDGVECICVQVEGFSGSSRDRSYWKCISVNSTSSACNTCPNVNQTVEIENYMRDGIEQPVPKTSPDFIHYLLDYAILLEAHSNNTLFKTVIDNFEGAIQKKFSYNISEMRLLYFKNSA